MLNLPLHVQSPGLLSHRAETSPAFDHLERWEIAGVVLDGDEGAGVQKFHHIARLWAVAWVLLGGHDRGAARNDPQGVVSSQGGTMQVCSDFASAFMKKWLVNAVWIFICSLWAWPLHASRPSG